MPLKDPLQRNVSELGWTGLRFSPLFLPSFSILPVSEIPKGRFFNVLMT